MQQTWQSVTTLPPLPPGELQVWRVTVPGAESSPQPYLRLLIPEEEARAERLRAGHVRLQFVVSRAVLRTLLGNLLTLDPAQVEIETGSHGKPAVPGDPIHFNLAHSGDTILIALSRDCAVGIDVEHVDREVEALDIARSAFSANEIAALGSISDDVRLRQAFFHCWTRKEAIIKADGRGLSLPLASFDVPVIDGAAATPIDVNRFESAGTRIFFLSDLNCGEDVAAAFAVDCPQVALRQLHFPLPLLLETPAPDGSPA